MRALSTYTASAALATALAWLLVAVPGAEAKPVRATHLVVAPPAGKLLPARPVTLRVRSGWRARFGARLNGRPIGGQFSRSRGGLRQLIASPSHGLRHGRNVLVVRVKPRGASRARVQRLSFRVARGRPLAAADRDRRVALGARFRLDGSRSVALRAGRRQALRYRWQLVRAPRASRLARSSGAAARAGGRSRVRNLGSSARFRGRRTARPLLRLDHPGNYRLRLTVIGADGRRGSDSVDLRVDPTPLVAIDTMAKPARQPYWGVKVGEAFYPDPGKNAQWLQLVLLKATTQELVWNRSYDCPAATAHPHFAERAAVAACVQRLRADVAAACSANAGTPLLAIAVSQRVDGRVERTPVWQAQPPVGYFQALSQLGTNVADASVFKPATTPLLRGRMSRVALLRSQLSTAVAFHEPKDLDDLSSTGEVDGFLVRDNLGLYSGFASPNRVAYETQAPGSTATANVMRVGSTSYPTPAADRLGPGEGGFQVTMVDPDSLAGASAVFKTRINGCAPYCQLGITAIKPWIEARVAEGKTLLLLANVGDSRIDPHQVEPIGGKREVIADAAGLVGLLSEKFGATSSRAYRALTDIHLGPTQYPRSYTLVAAYGTAAGQGRESEGVPAGASNGVPLAGTLARAARGYGYEPLDGMTGGPGGDPGATLRDLAFSGQSAWPEQGDEGRAAAIGWVGAKVGIDSRRSLFWTQPYTESFWGAKRERIAALTYPSGAGFGQADFAWAKRELGREIGWLKSTYGMAATLARPFAENELSAWADVQQVATQVQQEVGAPGPTTMELEMGIFLDLARHLAEATPVIGEGVATLNAVYDAAFELAEVEGGDESAGDPFSVSVADAGQAVVTRLSAAQKTLEDQIPDILVADYAKLRTVGLCAQLEESCPDKPLSQWQFTQQDQRRLAPVVDDGTKVFLYSALLPAKYTAWALPISANPLTNAGGAQFAGQTGSGYWCAFHGLQASAQARYPTVFAGVAGVGGDEWQVIAYAERTGGGTLFDRWRMKWPTPAVTNAIVKPRAEGGLGVDQEVFYRNAWPGGPVALEHYPEGTSSVHWITKHQPYPLLARNECGW